MLTIRQEQMKVLEEDVERRFLEKLVDASAANHPLATDLRGRVEDAMLRADSYGIAAWEDVLWFIDLDLKRGAAWELQAGMQWALEVLDAASSDVAGRRYRLEKKLRIWDRRER